MSVGFIIVSLFEAFHRPHDWDNVFQLFIGVFFYAVYFLVPAFIVVGTAFFPFGASEKSSVIILPIIGAAAGLLLFVFGKIFGLRWFERLPSIISALICVILVTLTIKKRSAK